MRIALRYRLSVQGWTHLAAAASAAVVSICVFVAAQLRTTPNMVLRPGLMSTSCLAPVIAEPSLTSAAPPRGAGATAVPLGPQVTYPRWDFDLSEVHWTVAKDESLSDLAKRWGIKMNVLKRLNTTQLKGRKAARAGETLRVFRLNKNSPTRSNGAPNYGRLLRGIPMPEGAAWQLRPRRANHYGTKLTITSLLQAFEAYAAKYPDGPRIRIGDISARRGGKLHPHVSHRTGRDIDIGYIIHPDKRKPDKYWQRAKKDSFDVERNWYLLKALIETGNVQQIYVGVRLQRLLLPLARKELSEADMARYFRVANPDLRSPAVIRHWKGHMNHMHVRFACQPGNARCRRNSR